MSGTMVKGVSGFFFGLMVVVILSSCDDQGEGRKNSSLENRLINSFAAEEPDMQKLVTDIVRQAREENYTRAMNRLALLSATRNLTHRQKQIVDGLVKQYRFDMEEMTLSRQAGEKHE